MLPISQIRQISASVDADWRSSVADDVAAAWGLRAGAARWLRSSATHVFAVPPATEGKIPAYLRFAPASSVAGAKLASSAPLMAEWGRRGLGVVEPLRSVNGHLTETVHTSLGDVTAMLVPAAPGDEVSVDDLLPDQASAWGQALGSLHLEGSAGAPSRAGLRLGHHLQPAHHGERQEPLMRAIQRIRASLAELDPAKHSQGICHGDFELDNIRFGPAGVTFFDVDEAHHGWLAADVALAVRDLTGVTLGSDHRPELLAAFLSGYRSRRPFTTAEEESLPLHSLAASARLVRQLEGVLDAGDRDDEPQWVRDLHRSLLEHQAWHQRRLVDTLW